MDEGAIYRAFGLAVAKRRADIEKTQERVAKEVGLSRASLANIERGKQRVFLHQILALADALELTSAHEIVPARAVSSSSGAKADVTMSGAKKLSRDQKMLVNNIVNALTSNAQRDKS
ncbi:MAG: helix-turn-helix domain-containing protein [Alphaproteobacteria bacterium]|nr:helix-turn-helix domain-containing protein [Alphaproteobacteria bacterium]